MNPRRPGPGGNVRPRGAAGGGGGGSDMPILENWEVLPDGRVKGAVYGRKGFTEGQEITTGAVVKRTSTEVTTNSGSRYRLGKPKLNAGSYDEKSDNGYRGKPKAPEKPKWKGVKDESDDDDDDALIPIDDEPHPSFPDVRAKPNYGQEEKYEKILGNSAGNNRADGGGFDSTLKQFQQDIYVGDRVKVKNNNHLRQGNQRRGSMNNNSTSEGTVMYIGPCQFASGREMIGLRMDEKPLGGGHDGKEQGERHFRCENGLGCFVLKADVTLVKRGDRDIKSPEEPFNLEESLSRLVGIESVKQHLISLRNRLEVAQRRAAFGVMDNKPLNTILCGSKGMDFKSVAYIFAGLIKSLGVTKTDEMYEATRKDLVGGNTEKTNELVANTLAKAKGGVLFIPDASSYADKTDHYGQMALNLIVSHFENQAQQVSDFATQSAKERAKAQARGGKPPPVKEGPDITILIISTQKANLPTIYSAAPSLPSIEGSQLEFMDYTLEEMAQLTKLSAEERGFNLHKDLTTAKLTELLRGPVSKCVPDRGGKILVDRMVEDAINRQTDRVHLSGTRSKDSLLSLAEADFTEAESAMSGESIENVLAKLDNVIGLAGVKKHVRSLVAQLQLAQKKKLAGVAGAKVSATMHMIFSGNPGTGKTTVARLVAELLQSLGYLKRGHLVETDRAGLVAAFVGQTAIKVQEVVTSAMGGMLFVDEAYALVKDSKDSFGKEALDTLIKMVEDHRDDLVVVLAGYPNEMDELMAHNPGVRSRFPTVILFEDYNVSELLEIANAFLSKQHLTMTEEATDMLTKKLTAMVTAPDVQNGNGRAVRNMVEQAMRAQALRLSDEKATLRPSELSRLTASDFV